MSISQTKNFETEIDIPQNVKVNLKNSMLQVQKNTSQYKHQ